MIATRQRAPVPSSPACPGCGRGPDRLAPVVTSLFAGTPLRRCLHCGTRFLCIDADPVVIVTCDRCGLPHAAPSRRGGSGPRCADCRSGQLPDSAADPRVARAAETEVRLAVGRRWRFVTAEGLGEYLNRIARSVAAALGASPGAVQVFVFDDRTLRSVTLPSGTVLLSVGLLSALEDEAELAFVLGHELAHVAGGDAARGLVRLGLHAVSRHRVTSGRQPWSWAAEDLIKLGHGRERESEADRRALEALLELRYDPHAALRCLERLDERVQRGDPGLRDLACSGPAPRERRAALASELQRQTEGPGQGKINREPFHRAAGREILAAALRSDGSFVAVTRSRDRRARLLRRVAIWTGLGIALLASLILAVGYILST